MELTASLEHYLETIYRLETLNRVARVKDIAESMDVSMASVVTALKKLSGKGLVHYYRKAFITLTDEGLLIAACLANRHLTVRNFLEKVLKLPPDDTDRQAGQLSACLEEETQKRLSELTESIGPVQTGTPA